MVFNIARNKLEKLKMMKMVATRGQAGSDGPVTSAPSAAAPVRHTANLAPVSEAESTGRCGERAASADPTDSAVFPNANLTDGNQYQIYTDGAHLIWSGLNPKTLTLRGLDLIL